MRREDLQVEELAAVAVETVDEERQGYLGGVTDAMEHRFCGEEAAEGDAEDTASELIAQPDLDAVGVSSLLQFCVGGRHVWRNPSCFVTVGTAVNNRRERSIYRAVKLAGTDGATEAVRNVKAIKLQNRSGIG